MTPDFDESARTGILQCLVSLAFGASEELLGRNEDLDLRFVGRATVQYVLSHGEGRFAAQLDESYICLMSHCGYDYFGLIADIAVQLSLDE